MKAYSEDLRKRVLETVDEGKTQAETAFRFRVSEATVKRYIRQRRKTGNILPKPITGRPPTKRAPLEAQLLPQLESHPDATLQEHCDMWFEHSGIKVSISTMSRAIEHLNWTRKKKVLKACERREEERELWREQTKGLDARKMLFLDESGSNIALTRLYARAPRGKRAEDSLPRNRGKNMTVISALSREGLGESLVLDGSANGELFERYIEHILAPSLKQGQILIMDNLSIHKGQKVRQLIEAQGCQLLFLPAYSPDFSPIEEAFSKIKAILRRIGARTREALQEALEYALTTISPSDAVGWFSHCGYLPASNDEI
jgi:transposase